VKDEAVDRGVKPEIVRVHQLSGATRAVIGEELNQDYLPINNPYFPHFYIKTPA
jgi:hypothetical protein